MPRTKNIFLFLLTGIVFFLSVTYIADSFSQSYQRKKSFTDKQTTQKNQPSSLRYDPQRPSGYNSRSSTLSSPWKHTSNLPLVIIDTDGKWIPNEPKTSAWMKIIYDESGSRNGLNSSHIHFEGKIGIEIRGQTSQMFPKKQYGIEIQDDTGNDKDVSLLGMPAGSDWVLNGPYTDKTLMRNYLAYEFSNRIGRYATRTRFVEVFLNTNKQKEIQTQHYVGVYLLIEKIKRGKNRIPIQSLKPTHTKSPEISGGYIIKIDKRDPQETYFFTRRRTEIKHVYPKGHNMPYMQRMWIKNYMDKFESALSGPEFKDPHSGYAKYIDIDSFIDHFIINEMFKNTDGFRISAYMYKDRGGKLNMGPVWDFNLSMGNTVIHEGWRTNTWLIYTNPVPFWWHKLLTDPSFKMKLVKRWRTLRKNVISNSAILNEIDRTVEYLSEAQVRNFEKWRILPHTLFANPGPGAPTYQGQVDDVKTWLKTRLKWMDENIEKLPGRPQYVQRRRY
ncbi:CotH kinase family protein [Candidatus Poribacteria bacterium]|nr:CotH kinase family protein [Candidatus Poribacteria bacterium]